MISIPGHLAIWPTLYTIGVLLLTSDTLTGSPPGWAAVGFVGLCAHGCYLLDRVKVSKNRLDPADQLAQPQRYGFLERHAPILRKALLIDLAGATALGWLTSPMLAWIPITAMLCVHLYAGRAPQVGRPRPKDLPGLKAFFIAGGHTALALATTLGEHGSQMNPYQSGAWIAIISISGIVFADAILCDLDDHDADQQFATKSIPVLLGQRSAWWIVIAAHSIAVVSLGVAQGWTLGVVVFAAGILTTDAMFGLLPRQRDAVDARLLPLAIIALLLGR